MCTDNCRALQIPNMLSKNLLSVMGTPVGLLAHEQEAVWATGDGRAEIWDVGVGRR